MQKNFTLNFKEFRLKSANLVPMIHDNGDRLLLVIMIIVGMRLGTLVFSNNYQAYQYAVNVFEFLTQSQTRETFLSLLLFNATTLLMIFLGGFSACGLPVCLGLPSIYGVFCSIICSCAYSIYKINGVFFSLVMIVPFAVLTSLLIITIANDSIRFSKKIIKSIGFGESSGRGEVKPYIMKGILAIAITLVSTLIQSVLISKIGERMLNI